MNEEEKEGWASPKRKTRKCREKKSSKVEEKEREAEPENLYKVCVKKDIKAVDRKEHLRFLLMTKKISGSKRKIS